MDIIVRNAGRCIIIFQCHEVVKLASRSIIELEVYC